MASTTQRACTWSGSATSSGVHHVVRAVLAELDVARPWCRRDTSLPVATLRSVSCVLEQAAVDLIGGHRRQGGRAPLHPLRDVAVVARREEEAQARLGQFVGLEVVLHPDHLGEVVGAQLDRRLPDLERRQRRRALALLSDEDRGTGLPLSWIPRVSPASPPPRIATSYRSFGEPSAVLGVICAL